MQEIKRASFALLHKGKKRQNLGDTGFSLVIEDDTCHRNAQMQENFKPFSANNLKPCV